MPANRFAWPETATWPTIPVEAFPATLASLMDTAGPVWFWCLDIDGTLVEIAPTPDAIRVPPTLLADLADLAGSPRHRVALVTGRSLDDARPRFPLPPAVAMVGSHGAEWLLDGVRATDPRTQPARAALVRTADRFRQLSREFPGTVFEDKRYSLSLHYRSLDPDREPGLKAAVEESVQDEPAISLLASKKCWDARIAGGPTKADGIARLLRTHPDPPRLLIFGDDLTDENAFLAFPQALTVRVGPGVSAARFRLPDPPAVRELVAAMAHLAVR